MNDPILAPLRAFSSLAVYSNLLLTPHFTNKHLSPNTNTHIQQLSHIFKSFDTFSAIFTPIFSFTRVLTRFRPLSTTSKPYHMLRHVLNANPQELHARRRSCPESRYGSTSPPSHDSLLIASRVVLL